MVFVDFKKAFDSLHRGISMRILKAYGIPDSIVDIINLLYVNTKGKVITPDGDTELFDILAGVLQGDTLAPYLFIIALDYCMRQALSKHPEIGFTIKPYRRRRVKAERISDTDFEDDIALIADTVKEVEMLMQEVERVAATVGLKMNEGKTKFITQNIENPDSIKSLSNSTIEHVEDFTYLGSRIRDSESDIRVRKGRACGACHTMKNLWNSKLRKSIKIRVFTVKQKFQLNKNFNFMPFITE